MASVVFASVKIKGRLYFIFAEGLLIGILLYVFQLLNHDIMKKKKGDMARMVKQLPSGEARF